MMRGTLFGMALVFGLLAAVPGWAATLPEIEAAALAFADTLTLAALESDLAQQRLHTISAEGGAQWFAGASLGQYQEPLTDSSARSFGRMQASAGLRIPVLGSREASSRKLMDARTQLQVKGLEQAQARMLLLRELRLAYSSYVRNTQKAQLAHAWLQLQPQVQPLFLARTREHALLEADRLGLQSTFQVARRDLDRFTLVRDSALAQLRRLSKLALDELPAAAPAWSTGCLQREALHAQLARRPTLAIKRALLEGRERQSRPLRWGGLEGGVTLQQGLTRDLGGQSGYGTVLGVDLTLPFDHGLAQRAHADENQLRLQQAQLELEMAQAEERDALDAVLGRLHNSQTDLQRASQRLEAAAEAHRIAELRARNLAGEVLEKAFLARYELWLSAIDFLDTVLRSEAAQIEALDYGEACLPAGPALDLPDGLVQQLTQALGAGAKRPAAPRPAPGPLATKDELGPPLTWFLWQGEALLHEQPMPLPAARGRLLVSFRSAQLAALQSDAASAQRLRDALERLHRQGWSVDLLLGDASYLLPEGRRRLLQQVAGMAGFAFDGINLDLERSDLPASLQAQWWPLTLATLKAVHAASAWPLTLTTHFRELDQAPVQAALQRAGVAEVMAMVYVRDVNASATIAQRILSRQAPLPITLVQSVEPELPESNSGFSSGRAANLQRWHTLGQRLSAAPHFRGIAVQSLQHFNAMEP